MIKLSLSTLLALAMTAALASALGAAEKEKGTTAVEVEAAGPDYKIQGEYECETASKKKLGVQVIAQGGGAFKAVLLAGGLPGAGWDGKTRSEVEGKNAGDKASFGTLETNGETIAGTDGGEKFEGKKVARVSPTMGAKPPAGAVVLFDGTNTDAWNKGKIETIGGEKVLAYGAETKKDFTSYFLHLEFRLPFKPYARGQERGNSGVYIHHTYEIQVLDSFGLKPENNDCGSLYTVIPPDINMCLPPLVWQTYDIDWQGPKFDAGGKKTGNAVVTVKLNGVAVHDKLEVKGGTGANKAKAETPQGGPLWLQDHGNPTYFRNVWLVEKK